LAELRSTVWAFGKWMGARKLKPNEIPIYLYILIIFDILNNFELIEAPLRIEKRNKLIGIYLSSYIP
jgi:hypothetical protein